MCSKETILINSCPAITGIMSGVIQSIVRDLQVSRLGSEAFSTADIKYHMYSNGFVSSAHPIANPRVIT